MEKLFYLASIAIIGLSSKSNNIPRLVVENLIRWGYKGRIFGINPRTEDAHVDVAKMYKDIGRLPEVPDIAYILIPARLRILRIPVARPALSASTISMILSRWPRPLSFRPFRHPGRRVAGIIEFFWHSERKIRTGIKCGRGSERGREHRLSCSNESCLARCRSQIRGGRGCGAGCQDKNGFNLLDDLNLLFGKNWCIRHPLTDNFPSV